MDKQQFIDRLMDGIETAKFQIEKCEDRISKLETQKQEVTDQKQIERINEKIRRQEAQIDRLWQHIAWAEALIEKIVNTDFIDAAQ